MPMWTPDADAVHETNMYHFMSFAEERLAIPAGDYQELWDFSISDRAAFWDMFRRFANLHAETWGNRVLVDGDRMPGAQWFPDARLNYAENMLAWRDRLPGDRDALVFRGEDKVSYRVTWVEMYDTVSRIAQALTAAGVIAGDRVAGYLPNMPETIMAMLATSAIGATWSSCSPDFGVQGVLDRFGQIEPEVLITVDGYHYNGKAHDMTEKVQGVLAGLPTVKRTVVVPY